MIDTLVVPRRVETFRTHRVPTDVGDDTLNRGIPIVIGSRGMADSVGDIRVSILYVLNTIPLKRNA